MKKSATKTKARESKDTESTMHAIIVPRIGQVWPGQGGIYAGICAGENEAPDYHLIVHNEDCDGIDWPKAIKWATKLSSDGHKDFELPTRREQRILFCNAKKLHQDAWYWSSEPHASFSDYAWIQGFDTGFQYYGHKSDRGRARAVRRLIIQ